MCHFFQTYLNSRDICLRYWTIFEEIHFFNFDKNLNPSCVKEGKKKEKNVSERVKRHLCSWWNNCTLEKSLSLNVIVYIHFYQQRTFLSQEAMFLFFFNVHDFIFLHCIYISNLKIHYGMASCRFDNLFFCLFCQYCSEFKLHLHVLWFVEICLFYKLKLWEKKNLHVNFD